MIRLLAIVCVSGVLGAQDPDDLQRNTALVRQYPNLDALITRAQAFVAQGRYRDALEIYVAAIKDCPNHLVPVEAAAPNAPIRYLGVLEYCLREMEKWPEAGRAAYRSHFDGLASQELEAARAAQDLQALAQVAERYPLSSVAPEALSLLGSLALEAGNPARAADAFERVLALSEPPQGRVEGLAAPDADLPRPILFARLGAAYAQAGRANDLSALADRARREIPNEKILLGDREVIVTEFLGGLAKSVKPRPAESADTAWECLQGNPAGTRVAEAAPLVHRGWSRQIPLLVENTEDEFDFMRRSTTDYRPLHPAVSDGIVYVHGDFQIVALNLYSSGPEALWTYAVPQPNGPMMFEERLAHTTSLRDGRAYATLVTAAGKTEKRMMIEVKFPFPKRALFCLDAYTGKPLWRLGGVADAAEFLDGLSFPTAPTPDGDRLYVGAIRQPTNTDPFEHYVLCLDAATGREIWRTFVASGGTEINLFGNSTRESIGSACAVAGDDVFYYTNHGAFATLDRRTGRMKWLYRYQQTTVNPTRQIQIHRNPLEWCNGAPVASHGAVFFAPTDSQTLFALDARTGEKRWHRSRGDMRHTYGVSGAHLVAGGDALEWYEIATGKLGGRFEPQHGSGAGRGVVASDGIYFPTKEGLYRVDLAGGDRRFSQWPGERDGGNVVAADGAIILAGRGWIDAFFDRRDQQKWVQEQLALSPNDPAVLYRCAVRLLQSGRDEEAADLFAKVAGDERLVRAAARRLFAVCMEVGRKTDDLGKAKHWFARARDTAPDPPSAAEATLLLCEAQVRGREYEAAVAELQRLIADRGEERARAKITAILKEAGPEPYRRFEEEARKALEEARRDGAANALLAVWRRYPNSESAESAVLDAAAAGPPDKAEAALRLFLREYPASTRADEAQLALVKLLEGRKRFAAAAAILRRLKRQSKDEAVRKSCEERLAREEYRAAAAATGPVALKPPLKLAGRYVADDLSVLRVEGPALPRGAGLLFLTAGSTLKAVHPDTGALEWERALNADPRAAFAHDGGLIVCTEKSLLRLDPATGTIEWRYDARLAMRDFCVTATTICFVVPGSGEVVAVDAARGGELWSQTFAGTPLPGGLAAGDDRVALVTTAPNRLQIFDADTGGLLDQALISQGPAPRILGVIDGLLVLQVAQISVDAYDLSTGKEKWRSSLAGFQLVDARAGRGGVFVIGRRGGRFIPQVMDVANGTVATGDKLALDDVQQVLVDDSHAYVVSRVAGRPGVRVRALVLKDLTQQWSTEVAAPFYNAMTRASAGHLVVFSVGGPGAGKFDFTATLLDKAGAVVQNIKGDGSNERPARFDLANDGLEIFVDDRVEIYR